MADMVTKTDLKQFLSEVKERIEQNRITEAEERQLSMNLIQQNAKRRGISIKSYLEQEGLGRYAIRNFSQDGEQIVIDEGTVYKQSIKRSKIDDEIPPKVSLFSVTKGDYY